MARCYRRKREAFELVCIGAVTSRWIGLYRPSLRPRDGPGARVVVLSCVAGSLRKSSLLELEVQRLKGCKSILDNRWAKKAVEALKTPEGGALFRCGDFAL